MVKQKKCDRGAKTEIADTSGGNELTPKGVWADPKRGGHRVGTQIRAATTRKEPVEVAWAGRLVGVSSMPNLEKDPRQT